MKCIYIVKLKDHYASTNGKVNDYTVVSVIVFALFTGKKVAKQEDLKEMGDISSGMSSSIMQLYLKQVLEAFFHTQSNVRHFALNVIALTLNQGLIHPVQVRQASLMGREGCYFQRFLCLLDKFPVFLFLFC